MNSSLNTKINYHSFPKLFYKFPFFLRIYHFIVYVTTLRGWYCQHEIKKISRSFHSEFTLLDAGCGSGDYIIPLSKRFSKSYFYGIDINDGNISICLNYVNKKLLSNIHFNQGDLTGYSFGLSFDTISCFTVLQYIEEDGLVLNKFFNALNPGGKLLLYVPVNYRRVFPFYNFLMKKINSSDYDSLMGIKRYYSKEEIVGKIQSAGFKILSKQYTYGFFGKAAFEIHSLFLAALKTTAILLIPFLCLIYLIFLFPVIMILNLLDFFGNNRDGNGILVTSIKEK